MLSQKSTPVVYRDYNTAINTPVLLEVSTVRATMGDRNVETLCHIGVFKANFLPHLYNNTPSPLLNVGFPVSRICLFPVQH